MSPNKSNLISETIAEGKKTPTSPTPSKKNTKSNNYGFANIVIKTTRQLTKQRTQVNYIESSWH